MADADGYCIVMTTTGDEATAERLAAGLVERRLAACVQSVPMRSVYVWQGEVERASEVLLLIKTRAAEYDAVEAHIRSEHSYEVSEVVMVPIVRGSAGYLGWIDESTTQPT
jgi:periplasmic divalent cation tolerance protein